MTSQSGNLCCRKVSVDLFGKANLKIHGFCMYSKGSGGGGGHDQGCRVGGCTVVENYRKQ